jgi:hypothetical protein
MTEWGKESDRDHYLRLTEQARRANAKPMSLEQWADYCREMAEDTDLPAVQRAQWKREAEACDRRLGRGEPTTEQVALF